MKTKLFPHFPLEDSRHHAEELAAACRRVIASGSYILGEEGAAFEREFAGWVGARAAVGVGSGTDAIELMLRALDIGRGAKVIVPSLTAAATVAGVMRAGAAVLLADCEAETCTLCPEAVRAILRSPAGRDVKAVLAVHLYGHVADWAGLQAVAEEHGAVLLEDAAQAHGATWRGRMAGTLGRAAAFSFYPTKNLGALGDAGAVVTADEALAERVRVLRQYGWRRRYLSDAPGVNSRLDELQAAVLRVKLATLAERTARRRALAAWYSQRLRGGAVVPPTVRAGCDHAWHLYVVRCASRDALMVQLTAAGIPVALHYPAAVHQQTGYAAHAAAPLPLPETERAVREILTLPLHPYLTQEAAEFLCDAVHRFA